MKKEATADESKTGFPNEAEKVMVTRVTAFSHVHGCGGVLASEQTSHVLIGFGDELRSSSDGGH